MARDDKKILIDYSKGRIQPIAAEKELKPRDIYGCTDPEANNYNPLATIDDGSCRLGVLGCTDPAAANYNADATIDDGSCEYKDKDKKYWYCYSTLTASFDQKDKKLPDYTGGQDPIGCKYKWSVEPLYEPEYFTSKDDCLRAVEKGISLCSVIVDEEEKGLKLDGVPVFPTSSQCLKWGKHYGFPTDYIWSIFGNKRTASGGGVLTHGARTNMPDFEFETYQEEENYSDIKTRVSQDIRPWEYQGKSPIYGGHGIIGVKEGKPKIYPIFTKHILVSPPDDRPGPPGPFEPAIGINDGGIKDPIVFMAGSSKTLAKWAVSNGPTYSESEKELSSRVQWLFNSKQHILFNYDTVKKVNKF